MGIPPAERKDAAQPHISPREAFFAGASNAAVLLDNLGYSQVPMPEFQTFVNSFGDNGIIVFTDTERYESDMERASHNAVKRPFGLEVSTLSDNLQLILYPKMIFPPTDSTEETAEEMGIEVRRSGPQAMLYPLDEIVMEVDYPENAAANLLFMTHLVDALLTGKYPLEKDAQSPEFIDTLKRGFEEVKAFVEKLSPEQRAKLSPRIKRIGAMDSHALAEYAWNYITYRVEDIKMHGLRASEGEIYKPTDAPGRTPEEAVATRKEYLRLSDRDVQERPMGKDTPSFPWREYGTNRYNRDYQLFGRYSQESTGLTVDFRLDTTHMPAKYGFFDTVEIATRNFDGEIDNHIVLGQEVDKEREADLFATMFYAMGSPESPMSILENSDLVFPIIVAGDFPFQNPDLRTHLERLANDPGTKKEVALVIQDALQLELEGKLQRVTNDNENDSNNPW